jgi:hypothetical protein
MECKEHIELERENAILTLSLMRAESLQIQYISSVSVCEYCNGSSIKTSKFPVYTVDCMFYPLNKERNIGM